MRSVLVLLAVLLVPGLALAHPGHGPYTGPHDFNPGTVGVVFGLTLGAAIAAWEKWGKQWDRARGQGPIPVAVGAGGAPDADADADADRVSLAAMLGKHLMSMSLTTGHPGQGESDDDEETSHCTGCGQCEGCPAVYGGPCIDCDGCDTSEGS